MIEFREDPLKHQIEIIIEGKVTKEDFVKIADKIKNRFDEWEDITLLEHIKEFEGMELGAWWQDMKLGTSLIGNLNHLKKCAVVGDQTWIEAGTKVADFFSKAEIKAFSGNEIMAAKKWLDA